MERHSRPLAGEARSGQRQRRLLAVVAVLSVASFLGVAAPPGAYAAPTSESEPNGSPSTANAIALGEAVSGWTSGPSAADYDYFTFTTTEAGRANFLLTFPSGLPTGRAHSLTVYTPSETALFSFELTNADWDGSRLSNQATYLPAGTFVVLIYGWATDATWRQPYSLTVTSTPGNVETEPNNSAASADALTLGSTILGSTLTPLTGPWGADDDYFAFTTIEAGQAKVLLTFPSGLGTGDAYEVTLFTASGATLFTFDLTGADWDGGRIGNLAISLPAGSFRLKVSGDQDAATRGQPYSLTVTSTPGDVETEPNHWFTTATALPLGETILGSALTPKTETPYDDYYDTDYDYFAFTTAQAGRVSLEFTFPSGLGTARIFHITVLDASEKELYRFGVTGADWDGSRISDLPTYLPGGTFYLKVSGFRDRAGWGQPYSLTVTSTPGSVEAEPNDTPATATALDLGSTILGSALNASSADYDYFVFTTPQAGRVHLGFTFPSGLGTGDTYDVEVFNSARTALYEFELTAADWSGDRLANVTAFLPAGTFSVLVNGRQSDLAWGQPYTLTVTSTPDAGEIEPNYSAATANPLTLGTPIVGSSLGGVFSDRDYFSFTAPHSGRAVLDFTYEGAGTGTAYEVEFYSASGMRLTQVDLTAAQSGWFATFPIHVGAGTNYVAVTGFSSYTAWGRPYSLAVRMQFPTTAPPTVTGTPLVGGVLTVATGEWSPVPDTTTYQWKRNGVSIPGATGSTYRLTASDAGKSITVSVTASKSGYVTTSTTSAAKKIPTPKKFATVPTPRISGTTAVGRTLTVITGTWSPRATLTYQWKRNGVAIPGATTSRYVLTAADAGKKITVTVTGTRVGYAVTAKTSAAKAIRAR